MKALRALAAPLLLLSVVSCDKAARIRQERADIEARIMQGHLELRDIDAKIAVYGRDAELVVIDFDQRSQKVAARNAVLESEVSKLTSQCDDADSALSKFRPRLDAYRAQNSH